MAGMAGGGAVPGLVFFITLWRRLTPPGSIPEIEGGVLHNGGYGEGVWSKT